MSSLKTLLLARPQFSSLKRLSVPTKIKLGKAGLVQISENCPLLEKLDLGVHGYGASKATDDDLANLPTYFPYLTELGINMQKVTTRNHQFCPGNGKTTPCNWGHGQFTHALTSFTFTYGRFTGRNCAGLSQS
jgi:hypothetical protein